MQVVDKASFECAGKRCSIPQAGLQIDPPLRWNQDISGELTATQQHSCRWVSERLEYEVKAIWFRQTCTAYQGLLAKRQAALAL